MRDVWQPPWIIEGEGGTSAGGEVGSTCKHSHTPHSAFPTCDSSHHCTVRRHDCTDCIPAEDESNCFVNKKSALRLDSPWFSLHLEWTEVNEPFILGKMPQCMLTSLTELPSSHRAAYLSRKCNKSKSFFVPPPSKVSPPINTVGKMSPHVPLQTLPAAMQNFHLRALCKHTCPPYPLSESLSISHNSKFTPRGCESISPGQSICRT